MKRYFLLALGIISAGFMYGKEIPYLDKPEGPKKKSSGTYKTVEELCQPARAQTDLNINNVRTTILGGGDMWWDLNTARYEIPKGSNIHSMFAGALWLGGVDDGEQLKLAAMTYRQRGNDFWPGPLSTDGTANVTKTICDKYDQHWLIYRDDVEIHKSWLECLDDPNCDDAKEFPGYESNIPRSILEWPGNGAEGELPYKLAPFEDRDGDQLYDPYVDYPAYDLEKEKKDCTKKETDILYGDQTIWWVYNDRGNVHTETQAGALGFEIRAQAFAFATNDEVNNMTFNNYRIINKSTFRLRDTYFSTWFDPDLGNPNDDIIGSDIPRGLGYCYNSDTEDEGPRGYGFNPPAVGFDFFQGPFADYFDGIDNDRDGCVDAVLDPVTGECVPENIALGINERIIMSGFMYYNNTQSPISGNPNNASEFYNFMRSRWRNGDPLEVETPSGPSNPANGDGHIPGSNGSNKTLFAYPGNSYDTTKTTAPIAPQNWFESPNNKQDKRGLHNAGPFSLAPGALNFITTGVVWERDLLNNDLFSSVEKVIVADDKAQQLFDNCFRVLDGPDAPDVTIQELDRKIILNFSYSSSSNNYKYQYRERDATIPIPEGVDIEELLEENPDYFDYVFEGYQVFQLANAEVSVGDIYISSQARMVAQVDVKNNITQLINWEIDPDLNQLVPQDMTIRSNNQGIANSFVVTEDLFATGDRTLINNRKYYYLVLAYGQNQFQVFNPSTSPDGQRKPYIPGRNNIQVYTGIPHLIDSEAGGTVAGAEYGDGVEITRIEGIGNDANDLELTDESKELIVRDFAIQYPTYKQGRGPVIISVIDPLAVPNGDYILSFDGVSNDANWMIMDKNAGDTIATSDVSIDFYNEQIIPELGLSVKIEQPLGIGGDDDGIRNNGVLRGELIYNDPSSNWLTGVPDNDSYTPFNWILAGSNTSATDLPASAYKDDKGDNQGIFGNILSGTWAPSRYTSANYRRYQTNTETGTSFMNYGMGPMFPVGRDSVEGAMKKVHSVDVVFTNDKSKWTRVPVIELCEDPGLSQGGRAKHALRAGASWNLQNGQMVRDNSKTGWSYFPGYAIDVETGQRLNMAIGENSWFKNERGDDMLFNPTGTYNTLPDNYSQGYNFGGQHIVHVFTPKDTLINQFGQKVDFRDLTYKGDNPEDNPLYDMISKMTGVGTGNLFGRNVYNSMMWTSYVMINPSIPDFDMIQDGMPSDVKVELRVTVPYKKFEIDQSNQGNPKYEFNTASTATSYNKLDVAKSALDNIRAVPNPYYGWSEYESSQLDNIIKITNLPEKCKISIFSTNGTLVRSITKDNTNTWVEWDLKNQFNVPIASGIYIIHVDAGEAGEKIIKWFGALRPVDLNAF